MAIKWETLDRESADRDADCYLQRAKVPGGWLVRWGECVPINAYGYGGMTFYPDPEHKWDGNSLP